MLRYISLGTQRFRAMRVVAGKFGGRPLRSLPGMDIRPTSDRLRETLFNVLTAGNPESLENTVWLDIFAGNRSGGNRSHQPRGAARFLCRDRARAVSLIERNLQSLQINEGYEILREDLASVLWRLEREHVAADVVFLDPPYRMQEGLPPDACSSGQLLAGMGHDAGDC